MPHSHTRCKIEPDKGEALPLFNINVSAYRRKKEMLRNLIKLAATTVGTLVLVLVLLGGLASAKEASRKNEQPDTCGLAWRVVTSANYDASNHTLEDVAVISPDDAWAVGYHEIANQVNQTFVQHWDG